MSYTTHGFVSGMKLTGTAMAEVDAQVAANEAAIAAVDARVDLVPGQRTAALRTLSLTADSDTVYLYLGDELLSSISLPDVNDRVACTSLSISGTLTGLTVGGTAQITATRQPSDCNQSVRYQSSDTSVATVTSAGLVTAVGSGTATIMATCGNYTQTLTAKVSRTVSLTNSFDECEWLFIDYYNGIPSAIYNTNVSANTDWMGLMPYDFDKYKIKNGEKITITMLASGWKLQPGFVVKAISGETPFANDLREDASRYLVCNVEQVDSITSGSTSYTYTNNTGVDCWPVFTVSHAGSTLEQALTDIDTKISMVIGHA